MIHIVRCPKSCSCTVTYSDMLQCIWYAPDPAITSLIPAPQVPTGMIALAAHAEEFRSRHQISSRTQNQTRLEFDIEIQRDLAIICTRHPCRLVLQVLECHSLLLHWEVHYPPPWASIYRGPPVPASVNATQKNVIVAVLEYSCSVLRLNPYAPDCSNSPRRFLLQYLTFIIEEMTADSLGGEELLNFSKLF